MFRLWNSILICLTSLCLSWGLRGFISADLTVPDIRAYLTVTQKGKSRIRSLTHGSLIDLEVLLTMGKKKMENAQFYEQRVVAMFI